MAASVSYKIKPGYRFGRLIAIKRVENSKSGSKRWLFRCKICGEEGPALAHDVAKRGQGIGCKCRKVQLHKGNVGSGKNNISYKHGHASGLGSPEYYSWRAMIQRCYNPNNVSYERYGAIGILVCERWWKFENFLVNMGPRPLGTTLDRIDVNGDYEPSNCRWADAKTQRRNQRWRE